MCRGARAAARTVLACVATALLGVADLAAQRETSLAEAVKRQDGAAIRALLVRGVDVNAPLGDGATALHWAAYWDDREVVERLIAAGADVNVANDLGITPLALASINAPPVVLTRLLGAGANPNRASDTGVTPLMEAARTGNVAAVRALVTHGADVNASEQTKGQTALMWAVSQRQSDVARVLVEHGADIRARTRVGSARVLLGQGARRGARTSKDAGTDVATGGTTALLFAAQVGDIESAATLLAAGADVNETAADGNSALVIAAHAGHSALVDLLLQRGADPNASAAGHTALHAAALRGDNEVVATLLAKGADVNARISKPTPVRRIGPQLGFPGGQVGATAIVVAAIHLEVDVLRALVTAGADVAAATDGGITPLLAVVGVGDRQHRLTRPKDFREEEEFSDLVRSEAGVVEAARLLLDHGADVNATDTAGDTATHAAAAAGFPAVIQLLADRGAALGVKNTRGQTPLALAIAGQKRDNRPAAGQDNTPVSVEALSQVERLLRMLGAAR